MYNQKMSIAQLVRLNREELVNYIIEYYHTKTLEFLSEIQNSFKFLEERNEVIDLNALEIAVEEFAREMKKHITEEEELIFDKIISYDELNQAEKNTLNKYVDEIEEDNESHDNRLEIIKILTDNFKIKKEYTLLTREIILKLEELYLLSREHLDGENIILFSRVR